MGKIGVKTVIVVLLFVNFFLVLGVYAGYDTMLDQSGFVFSYVVYAAWMLLIWGLAFLLFRKSSKKPEKYFKLATVLLAAALPLGIWTRVTVIEYHKAYPLFADYLAKQGLSTKDIKKCSVYPDLLFNGYYFSVKFKQDQKYTYDYEVDMHYEGKVFMDTGIKSDYTDHEDAKIREIKGSSSSARYTMEPVSKRIQKQMKKESSERKINVYWGNWP